MKIDFIGLTKIDSFNKRSTGKIELIAGIIFAYNLLIKHVCCLLLTDNYDNVLIIC